MRDRNAALFEDRSHLDQPLALLVDHHYLRDVSEKRPGRGRLPSPRYEVNPLYGPHKSHNTQNSTYAPDGEPGTDLALDESSLAHKSHNTHNSLGGALKADDPGTPPDTPSDVPAPVDEVGEVLDSTPVDVDQTTEADLADAAEEASMASPVVELKPVELTPIAEHAGAPPEKKMTMAEAARLHREAVGPMFGRIGKTTPTLRPAGQVTRTENTRGMTDLELVMIELEKGNLP